MKKVIPIIFLLVPLVISCKEKKPKEPPVLIDMNDLKEPIEKVNKKMGHEEKEAIDAYVKRNKFDMIETGTGVRYLIYEKGKGPIAEADDIVVLDFEVKLLDGTVCYTSEENGPEEFVVDNDHVESGLHEAIKYMHEGDKSIVIIPSHRAFGLLGDEDKIPPLSTVVYNLHVLKVQKRKK